MPVRLTVEVVGLEAALKTLESLAGEADRGAQMAMDAALDDAREAARQHLILRTDRPTPQYLETFEKARAQVEAVRGGTGVAGGLNMRRAVAPVVSVHEQGGQRQQNRLERFLRSRGWLPAGWWCVPTGLVPRDGYGNPTQEFISSTIKNLPTISGIHRDPRRLFVVPPGSQGRLPAGIWRTKGGGKAIEKIWNFVKEVSYQPRLDLGQTMGDAARRSLPQHMAAEGAEAIERAKEAGASLKDKATKL